MTKRRPLPSEVVKEPLSLGGGIGASLCSVTSFHLLRQVTAAAPVGFLLDAPAARRRHSPAGFFATAFPQLRKFPTEWKGFVAFGTGIVAEWMEAIGDQHRRTFSGAFAASCLKRLN